jgi:hypothetical protein
VLIRLVARLPRGDATRGCGASFRHPQGDDDAKYGKVERLHVTFRPDFLDVEGPFTSVDEAQSAVDAWVAHYNSERPHQALDEKVPVTPADRFAPVPAAQRDLVELWLPPALEAADDPAAETGEPGAADGAPGHAVALRDGGPVEFDRVVPASGNL